jgi:hypothetical protein
MSSAIGLHLLAIPSGGGAILSWPTAGPSTNELDQRRSGLPGPGRRSSFGRGFHPAQSYGRVGRFPHATPQLPRRSCVLPAIRYRTAAGERLARRSSDEQEQDQQLAELDAEHRVEGVEDSCSTPITRGPVDHEVSPGAARPGEPTAKKIRRGFFLRLVG